MPQFILLLHDDPTTFAALSPQEMQGVIERYMAWSARLRERGQLVGGEKLKDGEGRVLRARNGGMVVSDGPYAEAREVIGGYFLLQAASYDEAQRLCADCPHLDFGAIEVREIQPIA